MIYITRPQSPMYKQMTLEDLLFSKSEYRPLISYNESNTRTYACHELPQRLQENTDWDSLLRSLHNFNERTRGMRKVPRQNLYKPPFPIPKKSGGVRWINAPDTQLMCVLRSLKEMLENNFGALHHTSAFAYVRGRNTISAIKRHQDNKSRWFGKYDISDFFGSITPEFVMSMLSQIYPFCGIMKIGNGEELLREAIELAFLDGKLPQGTPLSPLLTNIIMIPIDHALCNKLHEYKGNRYVYTRYADDFIISSRRSFDVKEIEKLISDTLKEFKAPFVLNGKKTRYGSSAGSNWNLGVMLNKDNQITIGSKKKRQFQSMLVSYAKDRQNGIRWNKSDIQVLDGYRNYYKMVEGDTIDRIIAHISAKTGLDIMKAIKADLS